ncbi:heavy-metal-associated domain-containing protein [Ferrovibrio xuzhouensis]|uniref:Heavy-metal-associated domain-containing protein n=1 Tax=Ferrovibrio xuzhouensis TaxID=1576914 RepID=A0ABV7VMM3_9PROT
MHVMNIEGMTCEGCKRAISNAISLAAPGTTFEVDLRRKQVRVGNLPPDRLAVIRNAIRDAGYSILDS